VAEIPEEQTAEMMDEVMQVVVKVLGVEMMEAQEPTAEEIMIVEAEEERIITVTITTVEVERIMEEEAIIVETMAEEVVIITEEEDRYSIVSPKKK
jgi:hypothetical protein